MESVKVTGGSVRVGRKLCGCQGSVKCTGGMRAMKEV